MSILMKLNPIKFFVILALLYLARVALNYAGQSVAQTARPLLQAKVNLETAGRYLRLPASERANPSRLFAPQNEYAILGKGEKQ